MKRSRKRHIVTLLSLTYDSVHPFLFEEEHATDLT
jgi:hypothetical protein